VQLTCIHKHVYYIILHPLRPGRLGLSCVLRSSFRSEVRRTTCTGWGWMKSWRGNRQNFNIPWFWRENTQSSPVIYHDVSLKVAIWMQILRSLRLTLLAETPHTPSVYWNLELGSIGKLQIRDIQGGSKPGNSDLLLLFSFIFKLIYGLWIIDIIGGHWWCIYYTMTTCIDHWFYDSGFIDHRSSCRRLQRSVKWVCPIPWWPSMATRA